MILVRLSQQRLRRFLDEWQEFRTAEPFSSLDGHGFGGLQKKTTTLNTQNTPPVPPSRMNLPTPKPYSFGDGGSFNFRPCYWVSLGYQLWLMITWRRPRVYQNVSQKTHRVMALWMSHIAAVPKALPRFWTVDMIDASNFRKTMGIYQLSLAVWHEIDLLNIFVFFWLS